jgi:hypothetical protein
MARCDASWPELADETASGDPPPSLAQLRKSARTMTNPAVEAAHAIRRWSGLNGTPFLSGLIEELEVQIAAIEGGNLARQTALLVAQNETLNAIFYGLVRSALEYRGLPYQEDKVRLALRVQTHCRANIETIAALKNPRPVAYMQTNIGNAVQVNNATQVGNSTIQPTELLEQRHGSEWLDAGTAVAAGGSDPPLETVEAVNRAKDG